MLAADQLHAWDTRANKAISHLWPAIERALATGRPVGVSRFPASYSQREFVMLAVDLCRRADANVAVVSTSADAISVVPLSVTPAHLGSRRRVDTPVPL